MPPAPCFPLSGFVSVFHSSSSSCFSVCGRHTDSGCLHTSPVGGGLLFGGADDENPEATDGASEMMLCFLFHILIIALPQGKTDDADKKSIS